MLTLSTIVALVLLLPAKSNFFYTGPNQLTNMFIDYRPWTGIFMASASALTAFVSATFEIAGLVMFRRYSRKFGITEEHRNNLRLLCKNITCVNKQKICKKKMGRLVRYSTSVKRQ